MNEVLQEHHVTAFLSDDPAALGDDALTAFVDFAQRVIRFWYGRQEIRPADLEGVAVEAIEEAWKSRKTYRSEAAFTTWLTRIILRSAWRHWKKQQRVAAEISLETDGEEHEEGWRVIQPPARDNPAAAARLRILWDSAQPILSPRQLQAFQMARAGYSEREIGEALGATNEPESTAKQLLKHARGKLKKVFDLVEEVEASTGGKE